MHEQGRILFHIMRIFLNGICQCGSRFFDNIKYFDTLDEYPNILQCHPCTCHQAEVACLQYKRTKGLYFCHLKFFLEKNMSFIYMVLVADVKLEWFIVALTQCRVLKRSLDLIVFCIFLNIL